MGRQDNWHTPKQLKIEREKVRPHNRGVLKKGERRKGIKARLDELLAQKRRLLEYAGRIRRARETKKKHPDWYASSFYNWHEKWFDEYTIKQEKLIALAIADKIIENGDEFRVTKP